MRAFVLTGPRTFELRAVSAPVAEPGEVVVDVERVGVCGTDVEFFTGEMAYLHDGQAAYPMRLGHEWCGRVAAVGAGVDSAWVGRRVTGDTMLGDGTCRRCRRGKQHVCADRQEVGIRFGRAGALAGQVMVPASSLHVLPEALDPTLGALVEPAANALRAAQGTAARSGDRVLVLGPGTIGLLTAMFLRADGAEVHLLGLSDASNRFAQSLGFEDVWTSADLPDLPFDAVVDATHGAAMPAFALQRVEPGGRVVYIGLSGEPSMIDTRAVALKDVTVVGVLSASPALAQTVDLLARGIIDPRPLVCATVDLDDVGAVLGGWRPAGAGDGPKVHVDPSA
jgi:2-desacetyl-2-hydroxyethyl bacteriochlorophyllide A dehydrogenase